MTDPGDDGFDGYEDDGRYDDDPNPYDVTYGEESDGDFEPDLNSDDPSDDGGPFDDGPEDAAYYAPETDVWG